MTPTNLNAARETLMQVAGELIDEKLPVGFNPRSVEIKMDYQTGKMHLKANLYPLIFDLSESRGEI